VTPFRLRADIALVLFFTLFGTYAYFWQSRDWNAASRLMLTYSLVDRQQLSIDGLEGQAGFGEYNPTTRRYEMRGGDLARVGDHYFTDKAPGQSFLGAIVYGIGRLCGLLQEHPRDEREARTYWVADYAVTVFVSGLLTAALGVVIYAFTLRLGATHSTAVLVALAYGLGTPALVYATLFYGHQTSAFCTVTSFYMLYRAQQQQRADIASMLVAGLLAGYSVVVEYQTAVISGLLGVYAIFAIRRFRPVAVYAVAAIAAASLLAVYNYNAFGDPFDLGYSHEISPEFKAIHSTKNPLGVRLPSWEKLRQILPGILWKPYRGLLFYAPVLCFAPIGLAALLWRQRWGVALVATAALAWMTALNVAYPLWQGGWCTGPRLMVPAIPFAVLLVAGLVGSTRHVAVVIGVSIAAAAGSLLMITCVAVGGRFPPHVLNPVKEIAIPHWKGAGNVHRAGTANMQSDPACALCGQHPASYMAGGRQFERNAGQWLMGFVTKQGRGPAEPSPWQALQMVPLAAYLIAMVTLLIIRSRH
jgi:hypothetical protein